MIYFFRKSFNEMIKNIFPKYYFPVYNIQGVYKPYRSSYWPDSYERKFRVVVYTYVEPSFFFNIKDKKEVKEILVTGMPFSKDEFTKAANTRYHNKRQKKRSL